MPFLAGLYTDYAYIFRRKTPVFLPGKSHGQWGLVGYNPWDRKE